MKKEEKSTFREITEVLTDANRELRGMVNEVGEAGQDLKQSMRELCDDFNRCVKPTPIFRRKRGWLW